MQKESDKGAQHRSPRNTPRSPSPAPPQRSPSPRPNPNYDPPRRSPSPQPIPTNNEPPVDWDVNDISDTMITNDPVHQTRTQIFSQESQFHPVNLALRGPYASNTIQDAVLTVNFLTVLHNNGQHYLFRTFTPNMFISQSILRNFWSFLFYNLILNVDMIRPTTDRSQIRFIHAGLRYPLWRGITGVNLRRGLRAMARWLALVEITNRPTNSHPSSTLLRRMTSTLLAACAATRNRILSPNYPG